MAHVMSPRNAGEMESPDAVGKACLDGRAPYMTFYLRLDGDRIVQSMFQTFGCGYSIAACSVLTELVAGKSISDALTTTAKDLIAALDGVPTEKEFCAEMAVRAMNEAMTTAISGNLESG